MRGEAVVAEHPMLESVAEMSKESRRLYGLADVRATQMYKDITGIDLKPVVFVTEAGDRYQLHPHVQLMLIEKGVPTDGG
jgi:hypothetical protein